MARSKTTFKKGHKKIGGFVIGDKHTKESREKMSKSLLGRIAWNKGKKLSQEHIENLRKSHLGYKMPESQKRNIGESVGKIKGNITKQKGYKNRMTEIRRARKIGNGGFHTIGDWETLKAQYNWTCPCCGTSEPEIKLTEDHIIPLFRGGSDNIENIQPLCQRCNSHKATKIIHYSAWV